VLIQHFKSFNAMLLPEIIKGELTSITGVEIFKMFVLFFLLFRMMNQKGKCWP